MAVLSRILEESEAKFGVQKNLETIGGVVLDTAFERSTYNSRHVKVTKFVFLTVCVNRNTVGLFSLT